MKFLGTLLLTGLCFTGMAGAAFACDEAHKDSKEKCHQLAGQAAQTKKDYWGSKALDAESATKMSHKASLKGASRIYAQLSAVTLCDQTSDGVPACGGCPSDTDSADGHAGTLHDAHSLTRRVQTVSVEESSHVAGLAEVFDQSAPSPQNHSSLVPPTQPAQGWSDAAQPFKERTWSEIWPLLKIKLGIEKAPADGFEGKDSFFERYVALDMALSK